MERPWRNICVIPARGGSKRIPRKNVKDFCGRPIISYSIEAALNCHLFEEVMVSTDDEGIARIAKEFGASVPFFRTKNNADDFATTAQVLEEVIGDYRKSGREFDSICCIYPTAPLLNIDRILEGYDKLNNKEIETVFPVTKFDYPIWRGLYKDANSKVEMVWKEHLNSRSQDLETVYHDVGQWYWLKTSSFLKNKKLFTDKSIGIELSALEVQDIDSPSDWEIAELKYELLQRSK